MEANTTTPEQEQALWNEVAIERAAEESPASDTPPVKEAEAEVEAQDGSAAETPAPAAEADPFEGLSPAVRARFERLDALEKQVALIPQLQQGISTANGRVGALQRELDVARNAAKAVGNAPTQTQIAAAAASTDKWDSLKDDFPEWADATEQFVKASLAGLTPQQVQQFNPDQVNELIEQRVAQTRSETLQAIEEAKVEGKHEDWLDVIKTPDFEKWYGLQAQETQALAWSKKGRDAVRMLDLFKEARDKPADAVQAARANKLAAAVTSKPGVSPTVAKSVDQMTEAEFWNYEQKRAAKRGAATGLTY